MTAQEIYDATLALIDANNDADTSEYESKTLQILNILQGEVYLYSRLYEPELPHPPVVSSFDDTLTYIDDYLCGTVLPYGLGAHLLLDENPPTASYLNQRYMELLQERKRGVGNPAKGSEDIEDVYGADWQYFRRFTKWGGD